MNPERSLVRIGCLPICSANASAALDGLVAGVEPDDDLDQLHHRHRAEEVQAEDALGAARSHAASWAIGIDEVFEAMIDAVGRAAASRRRRRPRPLTAGSSTIASITSSQSPSVLELGASRGSLAISASASAASSLPRLDRLARPRSRSARASAPAASARARGGRPRGRRGPPTRRCPSP